MDFKEEDYGCHSQSSPVQIEPDYLDDDEGGDNSKSMTQSLHQGPDMDNCHWPAYQLDQLEDTIEEKYHIHHNVDNLRVYLEHNYSKHPLEIVVLKPEVLVKEEEEKKEEHQQHRETVKVEVKEEEEEIQKEDYIGIQIESIYSLSTDGLNCDPSIHEHLKVENVEESYETHNSDTLVQIEDYSSDNLSANSVSISKSSGLCIGLPYFEEPGGSSSISRYVNETRGSTFMNDSDEDCNEVDLSIRNARMNLIDKESDSELNECQLCGKAFSNIRELNIHCRIHSGGKQHKCKYCDYKTTWKSAITRHVRTHTIEERPYSCDSCDYRAISKSVLIIHVRTHTGERPFSCDSCDFKAADKSTLTRHIRTHTGERPFSCDFCDYKAAYKSTLICHVKTHTGERPFSCDFCDYKSKLKTNLTKHLRTHAGERPFRCDFCDFKATEKSKLTRHIITHTGERPFSCDLCDYKAAQKYTLICHLKTHTGERPFSCDFCGYKSKLKSDLTKHLRTHAGERPFSCDFCGYKSKWKSDLAKHLRTHSGE